MESNIQEIWKDVLGYEKYEVSNLGNVRRKASGRLLKKWTNCYGYPMVSMSIGCKKNKSIALHRLVGIAFIPNPENKPQVNHIDSNRLNPNVENLEWCTAKENTQHAIKNGSWSMTGRRGSNNKLSKLSNEDVLQIRDLKNSGKSTRYIAEKFMTHIQNVRSICNYRTWKHI